MDLVRLAAAYADEPGTCLLHSGGQRDSAQRSYLGLFPSDTIRLSGPSCWRDCQELLGNLAGQSAHPEWIGALAYSAGAFADSGKILTYRQAHIPDILLYRHACLIEQDCRTGQLRVLRGEMPEAPSLGNLPAPKAGRLAERSHTHAAYLEGVKAAKEAVFAGEVYQVNLSQNFEIATEQAPFDVFRRLAESNPASFAAYLRLPGCSVVCSSPERFLVCRDGLLETRPIKGTAPRGKTPEEDAQLRAWLENSEKDHAELLMITDLMRNDLGRVAKTGSVKVHELCRLEAYENVFHLLSRIEAQLQPGVHPLDAVRAGFPGGSITGCPKLRAMELIDELEQRPRHIYTGSIGYLAANGDFDFNIAIRTLLFHDSAVSVQLGGAIVADSDPESEYLETLHKGASIFRALNVEVL